MAERPSPQSIALCTLIALHSDPSFVLYEENDNETNNSSAEEQLSRILQEWVLGHHGNNQNALVHLLKQIEASAGSKTCLLVLEYVEISASSIDALVDLMESLRASVAEGVVDGDSSTGIYLRKVCLGFDELSFEAVARLWENFRIHVNQAKGIMTKSSSSKQQRVESSTPGDEWQWPPSAVQQERSLNQQCLEQDGGVSHSFEETEMHIQRILANDPELPAAHFLRFLNCLQNGERVGALDALHQYFDYAMIKDRKDAARNPPKRDVLQYAAILLAAVHSSFGDKGLSLKATEEAVRVAQASGDTACVAYALGWLFQNAKSELRDQELLKRCSSRAIETCLRSLAGGAKLSMARHSLIAATPGGATDTLRTGASTGAVAPEPDSTFTQQQQQQQSLPGRSWESMLEASADRATSSSDTATSMMDRPTHMANLSSSKDAIDILARQCLVGAGIWDAFGFAPESGLSSFVALQCYSHQMPARDIAVAMQNISRVSLHGNGSQTIPVSFDFPTDDLHSRLQNLDSDTKSEKKQTPFTPPCAYQEALDKLKCLKKLQPNPVSSIWITSVVLLLQEWSIRRGQLGYAASLNCQLHSYLHPRISNYQELTIEAWKQHSLLLCRQGQWDKAKNLTKRLCTMSVDWGLRTQHACLLMQLAMIQLESSPHHFISALDPLLECLSLCEKYAMDSYHAVALSLLAKIHLQLQNTKLAVALLRAALPSILHHAHIWFQGEAYLTLVKCELREAKKTCKRNTTSRNYHHNLPQSLFSAVNYLGKACQSFEKCQDMVRLREVYYLQARVYNEIPGHIKNRNYASRQFGATNRCLAKSSTTSIWQDVLKSLSTGENSIMPSISVN